MFVDKALSSFIYNSYFQSVSMLATERPVLIHIISTSSDLYKSYIEIIIKIITHPFSYSLAPCLKTLGMFP